MDRSGLIARNLFMKHVAWLCALSALTSFSLGGVLKINGSTTVNLPVAEAAEVLRAEKGMEIQVDTQGGSAGGISMLGDGQVHIGMTSKHISDDDKKRYQNVNFVETHIGEDAVAVVVSKDVWEGGVKSLTKKQLADIYESKVTNWKDFGGPDRRIAFFNKEPGRGTWEVFVHFVYGSAKKAPPVSFPEVGGNEETRNKVAGTRGAMSQLSSSWADGVNVFALAIKNDAGEEILPTSGSIATRKYPLSRPLFLLTNGAPSGEAKTFIDFVLSPRGQELVRKHGYLSLDQMLVDGK
jgi:phosphate transport system substrate-binding protein